MILPSSVLIYFSEVEGAFVGGTKSQHTELFGLVQSNHTLLSLLWSKSNINKCAFQQNEGS